MSKHESGTSTDRTLTVHVPGYVPRHGPSISE